MIRVSLFNYLFQYMLNPNKCIMFIKYLLKIFKHFPIDCFIERLTLIKLVRRIAYDVNLEEFMLCVLIDPTLLWICHFWISKDEKDMVITDS